MVRGQDVGKEMRRERFVLEEAGGVETDAGTMVERSSPSTSRNALHKHVVSNGTRDARASLGC